MADPTAQLDDRAPVDVDDGLLRKLDRLDDELNRLERVVVAFSGGADSAFLAASANARRSAVSASMP